MSTYYIAYDQDDNFFVQNQEGWNNVNNIAVINWLLQSTLQGNLTSKDLITEDVQPGDLKLGVAC